MEPPRPPIEDPFAQLAEWGSEVDKRETRRVRRHELLAVFRPKAVKWVIVLTVLFGLCFGVWRVNQLPFDGPEVSAYPSVVAPSGITATSGPVEPVPSGPFAGTPAEKFPEGAAGFVMPQAKAAGKWSQKEVAAALAKVRAALIAGHLDHKMLVKHDVSAFVGTLNRAHAKEIGRDIKQGRYGTLAVRVATGSKLVPEAPRVSGRTTYRVTKWDDLPVLEVITNYVVVYAFDTPPTWDGSRVVVVHSEVHWAFPKDSAVAREYRGMSLRNTDGYWFGMDCAASNKGFIAPGDWTDPSAAPSPDGSPEPDEAYYQPDHSLDIGDDCR